jgi:hypothetical protein
MTDTLDADALDREMALVGRTLNVGQVVGKGLQRVWSIHVSDPAIAGRIDRRTKQLQWTEFSDASEGARPNKNGDHSCTSAQFLLASEKTSTRPELVCRSIEPRMTRPIDSTGIAQALLTTSRGSRGSFD